MKTVGIVGGIGPESTIEYYRLIISGYLEQEKGGNYPSIIINSINMKQMLDLIGARRFGEAASYLAAEVGKLEAAGADFGLLASNTPHIVFEQIRRASSLPLISIVEATCERVKKMGLKRVGLFGTKFTMQSGFYDELFSLQQIEVVTPGETDQDFIHARYMGELVKGIVREETREGLLNIINTLKEEHDIDALVLGGTELPLVLKEADDAGIPLIDTTRIHVESILERILQRDGTSSAE